MTVQSNLYPSAQMTPSMYSADSGKCSRCERILSRNDFATNWIGQTVENCPSCGPALLVLRRGAPVFSGKKNPRISKGVAPLKPCEPCVCGVPIMWTRGPKPNGCVACRAKWRAEQYVAYNTARYDKRKAKTRARRAAKKAA